MYTFIIVRVYSTTLFFHVFPLIFHVCFHVLDGMVGYHGFLDKNVSSSGSLGRFFGKREKYLDSVAGLLAFWFSVEFSGQKRIKGRRFASRLP